MNSTSILDEYPRLEHPLRRLIKQEDAANLLKPFLRLMPGLSFGMLDADGELYAGLKGRDDKTLQEAWNQARFGEVVRHGDFLLRPLIIHRHLAGALFVWDKLKSVDLDNVLPLVEAVGNGFVKLLEQAVEKRDLGSELLDRYREINLLYRAAETIGSCLDPEWIPRLVLSQIQPVVPSDASIVYLTNNFDDDESSQRIDGLVEKARDGDESAVESLRMVARDVLDRVLLFGNPLIVNPTLVDQHDLILEKAPEVILCVPLKAHERILGLLLLGRLAGRSEFTAGDEKLVSALAGQAAIALETARLHQEEVKLQRLEEELSIGRKIQLSFLPESLPEIPGWDFAATYRSARQVGGDLYDFIYSQENPNRLDLVIGDITGKGVAAALFMAFTRTIIRLMAIEGGSPGQVLRKANHIILQEKRSAMFMSAFIASLDLESGQIVYSNAGHDWPLVIESSSGKIRPLKATGFLIGAFGEIEPDEHSSEIQPEDAVVFYTDGVTEAFNSQHELYGVHRLETVLKRNTWKSAEQILSAILADIEIFTHGEPQSDDLTLLAIKRKEGRS